jgi:hypothetical protein
MSLELKRIGWQNGTLVSKAKVDVNGTIYEVEPEQYEGTTPLSAENLISMENNIENAMTDLLKIIFPIGSSYITQENTNPNTILGFGEWERAKGKVLIGLDEDDTDLNTIGKTGGEKEHALTIEEMPSHKHSGVPLVNIADGYTEGTYGYKGTGASSENTTATGGGQPHNNMQPYEVVGYMWIRRK